MTDKYKPSDFYQYGYNNQFLMHVSKVAELMNQAYEKGFSSNNPVKVSEALSRLRKENEQLKEEISNLKFPNLIEYNINCPKCINSINSINLYHGIVKENEALKEELENWKSAEQACDEQYELLLKENKELKGDVEYYKLGQNLDLNIIRSSIERIKYHIDNIQSIIPEDSNQHQSQ